MFALQPKITRVRWIGPAVLQVTFSTPVDGLHQLYLGRRLKGQTLNESQRVIVAQVRPSHAPQPLQVVRVNGEQIGTDNGSWLPPRAYNVNRVQFSTSSWSGDPHEVDVNRFELLRGPTPGAELGEPPVAQVLAEQGITSYEIESDPVPLTGEYEFAIRGKDQTEGGGNVGALAEFLTALSALPPDFQQPFTVALSEGTATIGVTIPSDS
jgi:hypothetical protein